MEVWQEEAAQWWAAASQEQRERVMAVIRAWGMDQANHPDLEPGDSRASHGLLARELGAVVAADPDRALLRSWQEQPAVIRAEWVQTTGREFEPGSLGAEVAREVSLALAPPAFRELKHHEQVSIFGQIAGEIDRKLEADPGWYGKQQSRHYQNISRSIHDLMGSVQVPEDRPCDIQWSHMEPKVREGILGEIGEFARKLAQAPDLKPGVQQPLAELGRAVMQILAPERER